MSPPISARTARTSGLVEAEGPGQNLKLLFLWQEIRQLGGDEIRGIGFGPKRHGDRQEESAGRLPLSSLSPIGLGIGFFLGFFLFFGSTLRAVTRASPRK